VNARADRPGNPLVADLDHVIERVGPLWEDLRGARLFVAGGTGFVGRWMLESLLWADGELGLGVEAVVLSRDPERFLREVPHLGGDPAVTLHAGDVRSFDFPDGDFSHVLHMATETNAAATAPAPALEFETAVDGTRRLLELASTRGARRLLYTSSGAVYGRQSVDCARVQEDAALAPSPQDVAAAYAHGKRAAEFLCCAAHAETGLHATIGRLFAFVGPYLSLESGFAVGNFIRDAMRGETITVTGDGTPRRSYLYAADMAWWLWTVLLKGDAARPYNVGSEDDLSIRELADTVARVLGGGLRVDVARTPDPSADVRRYVPDTARARGELGLQTCVSLEDGIRRTAAWHEKTGPTRGETRE
jgi:dTDP-glucose 4,6-dehydratase